MFYEEEDMVSSSYLPSSESSSPPAPTLLTLFDKRNTLCSIDHINSVGFVFNHGVLIESPLIVSTKLSISLLNFLFHFSNSVCQHVEIMSHYGR